MGGRNGEPSPAVRMPDETGGGISASTGTVGDAAAAAGTGIAWAQVQ